MLHAVWLAQFVVQLMCWFNMSIKYDILQICGTWRCLWGYISTSWYSSEIFNPGTVLNIESDVIIVD